MANGTRLAANAATLEMLGAVSGRLSSAGLPDIASKGMAMSYLDRVVTAQANMLGFQDGFVVLVLVALAPLLPVALLMRRKRRA